MMKFSSSGRGEHYGGQAIYSNEVVELTDTLQTRLVDTTLEAQVGGLYATALNTAALHVSSLCHAVWGPYPHVHPYVHRSRRIFHHSHARVQTTIKHINTTNNTSHACVQVYAGVGMCVHGSA